MPIPTTLTKSFFIDTFYNDTFGTLNQVPILHEEGLDYANYTVQIVSSWLPSMSGALNTAAVETEIIDGVTATTASAKDNVVLRDAVAELGLEEVFEAEEVEVIWFDDMFFLKNSGS